MKRLWLLAVLAVVACGDGIIGGGMGGGAAAGGGTSNGGGISTGGGAATGGGSSTGGGSATGGGSSTGGGSATGGGSSTGGGSATGGGSSTGGGSGTGGGSATGGGFATTCPSGQYDVWDGGMNGHPGMNPGMACRACHLGQDFLNQNPNGLTAPTRVYDFMGTVFSDPHTQDRCLPKPPGTITIEIIDANGAVAATMLTNVSANGSGNFYSGTNLGVALPFTARVRYNGRTATMTTPQTEGDCNTCHTEQGLNGASGRIVWP